MWRSTPIERFKRSSVSDKGREYFHTMNTLASSRVTWRARGRNCPSRDAHGRVSSGCAPRTAPRARETRGCAAGADATKAQCRIGHDLRGGGTTSQLWTGGDHTLHQAEDEVGGGRRIGLREQFIAIPREICEEYSLKSCRRRRQNHPNCVLRTSGRSCRAPRLWGPWHRFATSSRANIQSATSASRLRSDIRSARSNAGRSVRSRSSVRMSSLRAK